MSKREVVQAAVAGRQTPTVPYHVLFLGPLKQVVQKHFGVEDINRAVGNYLVCELPPATVGRVDLPNDEWLDEWGVRWKDTKVNRGYVSDHPLKTADLKAVKRPKLQPEARTAGLKEACEKYADLYRLAWCGDMFERAHMLRGMENLLVDMHENPAFVHGLLDLCLESALEKVKLLGSFPVDAIILSDDYGQQHGPIFSPRHFREFIKPRLKQVFDAIRATGKKAALHSCGDVSLFIPDFVELGLDILHPVQPETMDLHRIKTEYGKRLCLFGGISIQNLLRFSKPARIRTTVAREKEFLSRGGGYILAPTLDLTHDVPLENALAFIEPARELTAMAGNEVTLARLMDSLKRIGLGRGDRVAVHSSYRALGPVAGGPVAVIRAFMDLLGPEGTLVMPVFTSWPTGVFRWRETQSDCGIITELFRLMPGVLRSLHPSHSAAAWGNRADWIVSAHEEGRTALGVDSPFDRLAQLDGKVLLIGVGQNRNSIVHVGEAQVRPAYLPVPYAPEFAVPVRFEDHGGRVRAMMIEECPGCSENFRVVGERMKSKGLVREGQVGNADSTIMLGQDVIRTVAELLAENPTCLLCSRPKCTFCPSARKAVEAQRAG